MAATTYQLAFAIGGEITSAFSKAFKNSNSTIQKLNEQIQRLDKEATSVGGLTKLAKRTEELHRAFLKESQVMSATSAELTRLKAPSEIVASYQRKQRIEVEKTRKAFEQSNATLKAHAAALGLTDTPMSKMLARQKELIRQTEILTKARKRQEKLQGLSQNIQRNSPYAQATGEYVKSGLSASITTGMDFSSQMSRVAAVSNASQEEREALEAQARLLGKTTVWSGSQVGQGMEYLSMAGFKTKDILAAMPGMLNLASAGGIDLGRASDISSNILTGFGFESQEMGRVGDVLTNAFTSSNTTLESLGNTMKYAAPVAKSLGASLEETAAMAGKLGDAGIQGEMAGTTLRAVMLRLSAPSTKAAEALKDLGIKTADAQGNMRKFPDILADLNKATADMSEAQRAAYIKTIFETEAMSGAMVLMEQAGSGALQKYVESLKKTGSAEETARKQNDNLTGDYKGLTSALESVYITIFKQLEPSLRWLTKTATQWMSTMERWISQNPLVTKTLIGLSSAFAGIAGSILPVVAVVKTFSLLTSGAAFAATFLSGGIVKLGLTMTSLYKSMSALMPLLRVAVMNPWTLGIMAAVSAGYLLYKNWDVITEKLSALWKSFNETFPLIGSILSTTYENYIKPVVDNTIGMFQGLNDFISGGFSGDWERAWQGIVQTFSSVIGGIGSIFKIPLNAVIDMINGVIAGMNNMMSVKLPDWLPGGGKELGVTIPQIPRLAEGGVISSPTLAMIGEGREPEAVMPLSTLPLLGNSMNPVPSVNVNFAPVINLSGSGNVAQDLQRGLKAGKEDLKRELERLLNAERRLSYT